MVDLHLHICINNGTSRSTLIMSGRITISVFKMDVLPQMSVYWRDREKTDCLSIMGVDIDLYWFKKIKKY